MKYLLSLFLVVMVTGVTFAQNDTPEDKAAKQTWKTLARIKFKKEYDDFMGFKIDVPVFSDEVKALDGKEVTIRGYIIPTEGYKSHKEFVFSAFPYNMCYFCGGAGPESVMEVSAIESIKYTAEPVTIKGILQLNSGDVNQLIYSMTKATLVKG